MKIDVLDQGYVEKIEAWGSDRLIIESARMSTDKGFLGWDAEHTMLCGHCGYTSKSNMAPTENMTCPNDGDLLQPVHQHPGDAKLLRYLYTQKHMTPFEMCGLTIEVKAPIMVFREWHRHRTQAYSEMSARYVPLPDENYRPTMERIIEGAQKAAGNRQAQGVNPLANEDEIWKWMLALADAYDRAEEVYQYGILCGVPKEIARLIVPVGRYSRMRATASLRNWLQFLVLRDSPHAQWEIQKYAVAVGQILEESFPRTMALFYQRDID